MKNATPNKYKTIDAIVTLLCALVAGLCIFQVEKQEDNIKSGTVNVESKTYLCKEIK